MSPEIVIGKSAFKMFGYKFFVYSAKMNKHTASYFSHRWRVCEVSTGTKLSDAHYQKDAISDAKKKLLKTTKEHLDKKIKHYINVNPLWLEMPD